MFSTRVFFRCVCFAIFFATSVSLADDPPSAVGSMLNLIKSNRVPESRLGTIVKLICDRGNEHDLRFIFDRVLATDQWPQELRIEALHDLAEASRTRSVIPTGDLSGLAALIQSGDSKLANGAIDLAGEWTVTGAYPALQTFAADATHSIEGRAAARDAMAVIASDKTRSLLIELIESDASFDEKSLSIRTLIRIDVKEAARFAAGALSEIDDRESPEVLLDSFLNQNGGSKVLAEAIVKAPPTADTAKLTLRHMFSVGRTDPELSQVLSEIAGIATDPPLPTAEELALLIAEVEAEGDAARGERVFRRKDLSCMNCHAVSKAGGQIGPDLSALGASSPVEYVVMSVLDPDQAIKEAYTTMIVVTLQGRVHQGIVTDRTANSLILKDATGKEVSIAIDDIDEETKGKSLMPKGLVKFMTHAEMVDLAKFLSSLGKPGPYAVRTTQRMQRWRLLLDAPEGLVNEVPDLSTFEDLVLRSTNWKAAYSQVNGELPIVELEMETAQAAVYVQGEVHVSAAGKISLNFNSTDGLTVWVGVDELANDNLSWEASEGVQPITIRLDTRERKAETLLLELTAPAGSPAKFAVVDGQ